MGSSGEISSFPFGVDPETRRYDQPEIVGFSIDGVVSLFRIEKALFGDPTLILLNLRLQIKAANRETEKIHDASEESRSKMVGVE